MLNVIGNILKKALPFLLMLAPAMFMAIFLFTIIQIIFYKNRNRKNPLTSNLLRSPGETLFGVITDLQLKILEVAFFWCVLPPLVYTLSLRTIAEQKSATLLFAALAAAILITSYGCVKVYWMFRRLFDFRLAYDGELAVGQELNELMLDGYRVYHDIEAEDFNIDHAIVGPSGVFAIETKTRSKKLGAKGTESVEVLYDGDSIKFPQWKDTKTLEQAKGNARWLEHKLTAAVGDKVVVIPAVAIPGWYTNKTTDKPGPIVYNGKNPRAIFPKCGRSIHLSDRDIERIAHQIDQLCRDIEPVTFNHKKNLRTM